MALLAYLNKERLQRIIQNIERIDGKSLWDTSASIVLEEFELLSQNLDADSLPHVLHIAYEHCEVPMHDVNSIKYLLQNVNSHVPSIQCSRLDANSIKLTVDRFGNWIPKIESNYVDVMVMDTSLIQVPIASTAEVCKALAQLVYFLKTWKILEHKLKLEDFLHSSDMEMDILMLALQEGLTPAEALLTPPFQHELMKKTILEELNAFLKLQKCEKSKKGKGNHSLKVLEDVERNSALIIGGEGAWNVKFASEVLNDFASNNGYGYNLTSFADLLRIIRNIFQHGHECPEAMLPTFGTTKPSPTQIMNNFFNHFPFLYTHSVSCFEKLFDERQDSVPKLYVEIYDKFESAVCAWGLQDGTIRPLKEKSIIKVSFESATEDAVEQIVTLEGQTCSCVDVFRDIIPVIIEKANELWKEIPLETLIIRSCSKSIQVSKATISHLPSTEMVRPLNFFSDLSGTNTVLFEESISSKLSHT